MVKTYKLAMAIYELDERNGANSDPVECSVDGYPSIDDAKGEIKEVVEKMIRDYKIPDVSALLETQIIECRGRTEIYVDNDACRFKIVGSKMTDIENE